MAFGSKIASLTNSSDSEDLSYAIKKGVDFVISTVASQNPELLKAFSAMYTMGYQSTAIGDKNGTDKTDELGYDWMQKLQTHHLLEVQRGYDGKTYHCRLVSEKLARQMQDPKSIYYSLDNEPSYYLTAQNKVVIYPDVSQALNAEGHLIVVPHSGGRTIDESNEKINLPNLTISNVTNKFEDHDAFPVLFHELVLLHAAEHILIERLADFRTKLPTDLDSDTTMFDKISDISAQISLDTSLPSFTSPTFPTNDVNDALTKAQNMIDGTTMDGDTENESVQYWLADEDEDMVQVTLGTAAQELSRANAILGDFNAELSHNVQTFQQGLAKMGTELSEEQAKTGAKLQEYQANLAKKMQLYNTLIQKLSTDYGWTQQQLQMINGKKQEFIATNIAMSVDLPESKV
jgi:hypothetical protein